MQSLHYRPQVQLLNRRADRGSGSRRRLVSNFTVALVELPHLAERAPAKIAAPRVAQIGVGDGLEATRRVESRCHLMGEAFVLVDLYRRSPVRTRGFEGAIIPAEKGTPLSDSFAVAMDPTA
jgi:hypothetical protein